jgi:hypothetical protein
MQQDQDEKDVISNDLQTSIRFNWKFKSEQMTLRVPKGRTITKLKSDIASYLQLPVSQLLLYQDGQGINAVSHFTIFCNGMV